MFALVPRDSFQELATWHRDMDEVFNRFFGLLPGRGDVEASWLPVMETFEKDGSYIVRLDMPGVDEKDIEISLLEDSLIIKGERKKANEGGNKGAHYQENSYGKFERRLALPRGVDGDKVSARYEKGVIEISLPLPARLSERKVPIKH